MHRGHLHPSRRVLPRCCQRRSAHAARSSGGKSGWVSLEKRAELGRTTSHVSGQEGRGARKALERIQGEGLPQGLDRALH